MSKSSKAQELQDRLNSIVIKSKGILENIDPLVARNNLDPILTLKCYLQHMIEVAEGREE